MWKVCHWGAKRFRHLGSLVWSSTKLLPRMRVNYAHITNSGSSSINSFLPTGMPQSSSVYVGTQQQQMRRQCTRPQVQFRQATSSGANWGKSVVKWNCVCLGVGARECRPTAHIVREYSSARAICIAEAQQLCLISESNRKAVDSASTLSLSVVSFSRCWWGSKWSAAVLTIFVSSWNPQ